MLKCKGRHCAHTQDCKTTGYEWPFLANRDTECFCGLPGCIYGAPRV